MSPLLHNLPFFATAGVLCSQLLSAPSVHKANINSFTLSGNSFNTSQRSSDDSSDIHLCWWPPPPSTSPGTLRGGRNYSLSVLPALLVCSPHSAIPLALPLLSWTNLSITALCYCKGFFMLNNSWNWLDWLLDKQDEKGVAQGVLGIYLHTTQEQPVSYLLQSQLGRKLL